MSYGSCTGKVAMTTSIDLLLARNAEFGNVVPGDRSSPEPSLRVAILTCMDARVRVFEIFRLIKGSLTCSGTRAGWSPTT